jgi:precorrin-2/cobalt-factor-2 C20-methyltransferase
MSSVGKLIGVGVGPGDPNLLTLKAVHALKSAEVVAHFAKAGNASTARAIVSEFLRLISGIAASVSGHHGKTERLGISFGDSGVFDESAAAVARIWTPGDRCRSFGRRSLFFGSYMHLHVRLMKQYPTDVIPGVTAMSGCWSAAGLPIAQGDDVLTVVPATLDEGGTRSPVSAARPTVIMKVGAQSPENARLDRCGRLHQATYVERGTMEQEQLMPLVDKPDDGAPYFAIVLVAGRAWHS